MKGQAEYEQPISEVQQEAPPEGPVPVMVIGPVVTQAAPAIDGDAHSISMTTTGDIEQMAGGDPRRSRLVLVSASAFYFATSKEDAKNPNAGYWVANVPLEIRHRAEVWVRSTATPQVVSASVERWAD